MKNRNPFLRPTIGDQFVDKNGQRHIVRELGPGESRDLKLWRRAMRGARYLGNSELQVLPVSSSPAR